MLHFCMQSKIIDLKFYFRYSGLYSLGYLAFSLCIMLGFYVYEMKGLWLIWLAAAMISAAYPAYVFIKDKGRVPAHNEQIKLIFAALITCLIINVFSFPIETQFIPFIAGYFKPECVPFVDAFCRILSEDSDLPKSLSVLLPGLSLFILIGANSESLLFAGALVSLSLVTHAFAIWLGLKISAQFFLKIRKNSKKGQ